MRIRWLGWAGVEIEAQGERVVVDPLRDPAAVFAWLGERARAIPATRCAARMPACAVSRNVRSPLRSSSGISSARVARASPHSPAPAG